jgi:uncharacterized protein YfcZ (UPF0381/DUF406 family)
MPTYTYFYIDKDNRIVSPFFDSNEHAEQWLNNFIEKAKGKQDESSSDK